MKAPTRFPLRRFWEELRRRHVVRVLVYYAVFAWVVIQVGDVMLEAFGLSHLLRYLVAGVVAAFPVALALSWMFDITPGGLERTQPLPQPVEAPAGSLAVLPFANLSDEVENEYFSDGLSEEIRNQLAAVPGLKVAARSSSFAFKGRHEDTIAMGTVFSISRNIFGPVGLSLIGALFHNAAQLFFAYLLFIQRIEAVLIISPVILHIGTLTGFANGLVADILIKNLLKKEQDSIQNKARAWDADYVPHMQKKDDLGGEPLQTVLFCTLQDA